MVTQSYGSTEGCNIDYEEERHTEQDTRAITMIEDVHNYFLLITEDCTTTPAGFVWWQLVQGRSPSEWEETHANRYRPPGMNLPLSDATNGARLLKRQAILTDETCFMLKELYITPEYQRRGLGGRLVEWGVKKADELGLPAYTDATPEGLGLYLKHGFLERDRVTVELEQYGGRKGDVSSYALLYRPARQP